MRVLTSSRRRGDALARCRMVDICASTLLCGKKRLMTGNDYEFILFIANKMKQKLIIFSMVLLVMTSCFGGMEKQGSVKSYYNGIVRTVGGAFRIGSLPRYWDQKSIKFRALLFENDRDGSTITIDSWCRGAYSDSSLTGLMSELRRGLADVKTLSSETVMIDQRAALNNSWSANLDGRTVFMNAYVIKKDNCVFDFVYVTLPGQQLYEADFHQMVRGFKLLTGPDLI